MFFVLIATTLAGPLDVREHAPIELVSGLQVPEGASGLHDWTVPAPATLREYRDGDLVAVWAPPGTYEVDHELIIVDWETRDLQKLSEVFTINVRPRAPPDVDPVDTVGRLAIVVYESSEQRIPLQVHAARIELERTGHTVRVIDRDATTGTGEVPDEVAAAIAADRLLPHLVVLAGDRVISKSMLPATAAQIVSVVTR